MNEVRAYGARALLVTPDASVRPLALAAAIDAAARAGVVDVVPAAATVLVTHEPAADHSALAAWLADLSAPEQPAGPSSTTVELDVVYDGDDLAAVAQATGLSVADVVRRHSEAEHCCQFCGFAPGFGYLSGLDPALHVARRATPRTRVPAGSVAIAGPYSAVYPSDSPGGWHLLGRSAVALWDPAREPAALITPGTRVRFRPVDVLTEAQPAKAAPRAERAAAGVLRVIAPGWSTTVQDAGRPGLASVGVAPSGALDPGRRALVNRLVGNVEGAAVLETAGGLVVEAVGPAVVAESTTAAVRTLAPGDHITVDPAALESWAYLAIRGGLDVEPVLGSRSRDQLAGLGPEPPAAGTRLPAGPDPGTPVAVDQAPVRRRSEASITVTVHLGPRDDWFTRRSIDALLSEPWTVTADRSRVGLRLQGPRLDRPAGLEGTELPSEGLVTGAIQVPADGQPIVMLADHPTTGGYPVIAVVDDDDVGAVAQCPAGVVVRFRRA